MITRVHLFSGYFSILFLWTMADPCYANENAEQPTSLCLLWRYFHSQVTNIQNFMKLE